MRVRGNKKMNKSTIFVVVGGTLTVEEIATELMKKYFLLNFPSTKRTQISRVDR